MSSLRRPTIDEERNSSSQIVDMVVVGASGEGSCTNGCYKTAGVYNGKPKFKQMGGDSIVYFDREWKIIDEDDETAGWIYYATCSVDDANPLDGQWSTAIGCKAGPPFVLKAVEIVVTGAGGDGASTNGRYELVGVYNAKPKFKQVDGESIIYHQHMWKVLDEDDPTAGWIYHSPESGIGVAPPDGQWESAVGSNADPPPMVSLVSQASLGGSKKNEEPKKPMCNQRYEVGASQKETAEATIRTLKTKLAGAEKRAEDAETKLQALKQELASAKEVASNAKAVASSCQYSEPRVALSTSRLPRPSGAAGTFLRIVSINDVYKLDNYPQVATAIKEFKAAGAADDAVVLSCLPGDFLSPCTLTILDGGIAMLKALNEISIDYTMFGNHEFDLKTPQLQKRIQEYNGKWINSNVTFPEFVDSSGKPLPSFDVIQVGGRKVALAAFLLDDMSLYPQPQPKIVSPIVSIADIWRQLKNLPGGPVDAFLPMLHLGIKKRDEKNDNEILDKTVADFIAKDPSMAACTPVLLSAHDHEVYIEEAGKSVICKFGMDAENIGVVDLFWTAEGSLMRHVHLFSAKSFAPDKKVQQFVDQEESLMQKLLDVHIVDIPDLGGKLSTAKVRLQMELMASFLASIVRKAMTDVDIVLINGGSVRGKVAEYQPGPFTYGDLMKEFAYEMELAIVQLPGTVLEESIRYTRTGELPKASFLHCDLDTTFASEDGRIEKVNGNSFEASNLYQVAMPQGLLTGLNNIQPLVQFFRERDVPDLEACRPIKEYFLQACMRDAWLDILGLNDGKLDHEANRADVEAALDKIFHAIDCNKNGFIEATELEDYVLKMETGTVSVELVNFLIQCFDTNTDGKLSRAEFSLIVC